MSSMQLLPGFRDFYPDDCARRNYILATWREVARRYGFSEYDGAVLEPIELYKKKSGGELLGQLFDFTDKGDRHVAMRPEITPTLARMVAAREREFKKPLKWFSVPQCFRYEKQQRGRGREFYQFNADIIGEASPNADAEMLALVIDLMRAFGFSKKDFVIRVSDRNAWTSFATSRGVADEKVFDLLGVVDKLERMSESEAEKKLAEFGITVSELRAFIANPSAEAVHLKTLKDDLKARGLDGFVELDMTIVRGIAYYTGFVFEVFDRAKKERALAGGGRYDKLLRLMSNGKCDLPALGFGMGDVVLGNMIDDNPAAKARMNEWIEQQQACEIYIVLANDERRSEALAVAQKLRNEKWRVDFSLTASKVGKQFKTAEQLGAKLAVVIGDEWPEVKIKTLANREEITVSNKNLVETIREMRSLLAKSQTAQNACHSEQSEESHES